MKEISMQDDLDFHLDSGVLTKEILEHVVKWVGRNLEPNQVFEDGDLKEYVADTFDPDEVFKPSALDEWAIDNGYARED